MTDDEPPICVECGNDHACDGLTICLECAELLGPDADNYLTERQPP